MDCLRNEDCTDGNECNGKETCVAGKCYDGAPLNCDDANPCTDDTCDVVFGCRHSNNAASCDDGIFCNGEDQCQDGICRHAGDPCTLGGECANVCQEADRSCELPPGTPCSDDGLACTQDRCLYGYCRHTLKTAGTLCRPGRDECDPPEYCSGYSAACPTDLRSDDGTACTDDKRACTDDLCYHGACRHMLRSQGALCRTSRGECDPPEFCTGASADCPTDRYADDFTTCTDDDLACSDDYCSQGICIHPARAKGTICREAEGHCDVAETCNGVALTCPVDQFQPLGTVCASPTSPCEAPVCDGQGQCQLIDTDNPCNDGLFCDGEEYCDNGVCTHTGDPCASSPDTICSESHQACMSCVTISGTVFDHSGSPYVPQGEMARLAVPFAFTGTGEWKGVDLVVTSSNDGGYEACVPLGWSGFVRPDENYYSDPPLRRFDAVDQDQLTADFMVFRIWYVDGAFGADAPGATGTLSDPFTSIQTAADRVLPGDMVLVKAGIYHEWVKIKRGGTVGQPVLFRPFEDDEVIIAGDGKRHGCLSVGDPSNVYWGSNVVVDGFRMTGTASGTGAGGGGACALMWHANRCVFRNLDVWGCGYAGGIPDSAQLAVGIALRGRNRSCRVENCSVHENYRGGIVVGAASTGPGFPLHCAVENCYVHDNPGPYGGADEHADGIWVNVGIDDYAGNPLLDSGIVVRNNIVHDNADDGIDAPSSNGVLIAGNIAFDQGRHTSTGDGNGIKVSTSVGGNPNGGGNHLVMRNIVFANARSGIDQDISPEAKHNQFYFNTIVGNDRHGFVLDVGGCNGTPSERCNIDVAAHVLNNIMYENSRIGGSYLDYRAGTGGCGNMFQDNVIRESDFNIIGDGCFHGSEGSASLGGDPLFEDAQAPIDTTWRNDLYDTMDSIRAQVEHKFALAARSPALDSGADLNLDDVALDDGAAPNVGAVRFGTHDYVDRGAVENGLVEVSFRPDGFDAPTVSTSRVMEGVPSERHRVDLIVVVPDGGATPDEIKVDVIDRTGSAYRWIDYAGANTTVTIPQGTPNGTVIPWSIGIFDDAWKERAESFDDGSFGETIYLGLANVRGPARIVRPSGHHVQIVDDD